MRNVNVGIFGHIDSGKTSIAKRLSKFGSTAAFDKSPQSQQRGITLDLGFSAFYLELSAGQIKEESGRNAEGDTETDKARGQGSDQIVQVTLVDCPGHASLIRTVIGGAQIIDQVILVVDATKGIQVQTAECILLAEILVERMVVVLNKVDLLPLEEREGRICKLQAGIGRALSKTKFSKASIIPHSAKMESGEYSAEALISALAASIEVPQRKEAAGHFLFSVDHCFTIKGKGAVMTGTCLSGSVRVGDEVEIPSLKLTRKIKSIQIYREPVESVSCGDRAALMITNMESGLLERGLVCSPGSLKERAVLKGLFRITRVPYFKQSIHSGKKFHISIGYETVMGTVTFVKKADNGEYEFLDELQEESGLGVIELEQTVIVPRGTRMIGSRLDFGTETRGCRIAFWGTMAEEGLGRIFRYKLKEGQVDRVVDPENVIVRGLASKESQVELYVGKKIVLRESQRVGVIEGRFGQSGRLRCFFRGGHGLNGDQSRSTAPQPAVDQTAVPGGRIVVDLTFKKYISEGKEANKLQQ